MNYEVVWEIDGKRWCRTFAALDDAWREFALRNWETSTARLMVRQPNGAYVSHRIVEEGVELSGGAA